MSCRRFLIELAWYVLLCCAFTFLMTFGCVGYLFYVGCEIMYDCLYEDKGIYA